MGILRPQSRRICCASRSPPRWFVRSARWAWTGCSPMAARDLIATATRRAQAGLDAAHSGLELASLELTYARAAAGSG